MEGLRDMEASLPQASDRTEPLAIPSGVFVFGGGSRAATSTTSTATATPSKAVDAPGGQLNVSPIPPELDRTVGPRARRMSASKSSSRGRRGSSSSWASTAMTSKLRSKEAAAAAREGGSSSLLAPVAGGVSDRAMAHPSIGVEDSSCASRSSRSEACREIGDEAKEDGGDVAVAPRGRGEGGRSSWSGMDRKAALRQQQQRLLLLRHASKCQLSEGQGNDCQVSPDCAAVKRLWKHIADCQDKTCMTPHCVSSRFLLSHYLRCKIRRCPLCCPVRAVITKERRLGQQQQQQSSSGGEGEEEDDMEEDNDDDDEDDEL